MYTHGLTPFASPIGARRYITSQSAGQAMPSPTHRKGAFGSSIFMGRASPHVSLARRQLSELELSELTHVAPRTLTDRMAIRFIRLVRWLADKLFRDKYVHRALMLKPFAMCPAVAASFADYLAVPLGARRQGSSPDALRCHMNEAECLHQHAAIIDEIVQPSIVERCVIVVVQLIKTLVMVLLYLFAPSFAHRLNAYAAEEACVILTHMINDIDSRKVVDVPATPAAVAFWGLESLKSSTGNSGLDFGTPLRGGEKDMQDSGAESTDNGMTATTISENPPPAAVVGSAHQTSMSAPSATLRDVVLLMRADMMTYRDINHEIATGLDRFQRSQDGDTSFR